MNMYILRSFDLDLNECPLMQLIMQVEVRYNHSDWKLACQLLRDYEKEAGSEVCLMIGRGGRVAGDV